MFPLFDAERIAIVSRTMRTTTSLFLSLALIAIGCRVPSYAREVRIPASSAPVSDLTGTWNTHWGDYVAVVFLKQEGELVSGSYTTTARPEPGVEGTLGGTLQGRLVGNELRGQWEEGPSRSGSFRFVFRADGAVFEGTWGNGGFEDSGGTWVGSR